MKIIKRVEKLRTKNKIVLFVGSFLAVFVLYTVAFYSAKGWQRDGLFPYILGARGAVEVVTGALALAELLTGPGGRVARMEPVGRQYGCLR